MKLHHVITLAIVAGVIYMIAIQFQPGATSYQKFSTLGTSTALAFYL